MQRNQVSDSRVLLYLIMGETAINNVIWIKNMNKLNSQMSFAVCVNNTDYPASLELHKIYAILSDEEGIKDGDLRVIDESGEDYLYPADYFVLVELPTIIKDSVLAVV